MSVAGACIRQLIVEEVHDAWLIETQGFPSDEAASEETFKFRQKVAPDLFWGYFHNSRLVGVLNATRTGSDKLTHDSMYTHDPEGAVVCVHSLCIQPDFRRKGIASRLMKHFLQFIRENLSYITKVCLLCHDVLVPFYERLHFRCIGPSAVAHGPIPWFDMEYCFSPDG